MQFITFYDQKQKNKTTMKIFWMQVVFWTKLLLPRNIHLQVWAAQREDYSIHSSMVDSLLVLEMEYLDLDLQKSVFYEIRVKLTCKIWKQEIGKQINTQSFLVQYNGGLVTLLMRYTMKLDKIYVVKSSISLWGFLFHLEFLVAFGSTQTKYLQKVLVCVRTLFLNIQDFYFSLLLIR